jgi:hypothetical protein
MAVRITQKNLQYFGDDDEVGEVGEYFGDEGDICAGATRQVISKSSRRLKNSRRRTSYVYGSNNDARLLVIDMICKSLLDLLGESEERSQIMNCRDMRNKEQTYIWVTPD